MVSADSICSHTSIHRCTARIQSFPPWFYRDQMRRRCCCRAHLPSYSGAGSGTPPRYNSLTWQAHMVCPVGPQTCMYHTPSHCLLPPLPPFFVNIPAQEHSTMLYQPLAGILSNGPIAADYAKRLHINAKLMVHLPQHQPWNNEDIIIATYVNAVIIKLYPNAKFLKIIIMI